MLLRMKKRISKHLNRQNLIEAAAVLKDVDYCVFYGTALGIHRDGDIIEGDDDVDLFVENKDFDKVDKLLKEAGFRSSQEINGQPVFPGIFSQYYKTRDSEFCLLDIYFYDDVHDDFVIDRWNISGKPDDKKTYIIFPKKIIFETKEVDFFDAKVKMPRDAESLCRYIYGNRYKEPLVKDVEYRHSIVNNRFVVVYNR